MTAKQYAVMFKRHKAKERWYAEHGITVRPIEHKDRSRLLAAVQRHVL